MANKKISELPLINALSGSQFGGTVIPVVVGGTTAQISVENFSRFVNAYNAHTGSAGNTFKGPQIIQSTLSVTGNASVDGNLVVGGRITAEEFHTEITTASVIYASGSTKFGDDTGDKHEFTGSINLSGSLLYNGVTLLNIDANTINRLQQTTASLQQATSSLQAHSASVNAQLLAIQQTTQSLQVATASLQFHSASVNAQLLAIQQTTQSLQIATASIQAQTASLLAFTASQDSRNFTLSQVTGSFNYFYQATASLQAFTASQDDRNLVLAIVTASFNYFYQATASLQSFTASQADRNLVLSTVTGSLNQATASIQTQTASLLAFTASQDSRNFTLSQVTGSFRGEIGGLEEYSASLKSAAIVSSSTQVQNYDLFALNSNLYTSTGSLIGITNGLMAFTAALDATYATDAQLYELYQATASLNTTTGSLRDELAGIEAYTASLKGQAIVSSSTQVQNYDLFALNSNLYNGTGSIKDELAGIEAYTASLKGQAIVSSSTQVQNYDLFALNSNLYTSTGSIKGEIAGIEAYTSSLKAAISVSGTNVQIIGDLNVNKLNVQYISSSVLVTSGSNIFGDQSTDKHEFTGSVYLENSLILGTEVLGNAGLNAISASTRIELNSIEAYTASLKTAAIVSSSTQVQNYDVFGLNSNLYNSTGSLIGITNGLMALTASLKSQSILSGSGLTNYIPIYNGATALSSSIIFQSTGSIGTGGKGITIGSDVAMYKFAVNPIANTYFGIGYTDTDSVFMTAVDNTYLPKPIVYAASSYKWYANSLTSTYNLTMVIQSSSLNVGFGGIENPLHKVDISGSARVSNGMTVSGSLLASGSSHTIQNGYVILQQVSQSLNFVDDTAAAAGGVPLGGLYRNGNFIVIRIV